MFNPFILVINQIDAQNFCFTKSFFHASTCFGHHVLIIRSKLYYTASGIITPIGGRPVHSSSLNPCTRRPPIGVMITKAVEYNFELLMMSTWYSKHVEAWNKLIVEQKYCASSWLITKKNILRRTVSKTSTNVQSSLPSVYLFHVEYSTAPWL